MATNQVATFSGIASGIDWQSMIDEIMKVESAPITRLESQISLNEQQSTAWDAFRAAVQALQDASGELRETTGLTRSMVDLGTVPAGTAHPLASATVEAGAPTGSYSVRVLALATAEKVGGDIFASRTDALGLSGELLVNGKRVEILATDSLDLIAKHFNDANTGSGATGAAASVTATGGGFRLVLNNAKTGAAGIDLIDGATGVLHGLGFLDSTAVIKNQTSSGAQSDAFTDATTALATLRGLTAPAAAAVTIGSVAVTLDLAAMSLDDVAAAINTAAAAAGKALTASVIDDTSTGVTTKRLDIRGTTQFTDVNGILESLGVLEAGRGAVAHQLQGPTLTQGDAVTPAATGTALSNLWTGGAAAGVQAGDTITLNGMRGDGTTFSVDYTVGAGDTVQSLLDRLNSAVDGFGFGTRTATASLDAAGHIVVTDATGGPSRLALSMIAHNEGGGTLDLGTMSNAVIGRARLMTAGADAELEVDGAYVRQATNTIDGAIAGVSLSLAAAAPASPVTVSVARDTATVSSTIQALVKAYNDLADFVDGQLTPVPEGETPNPLYGNSTLRSMRTMLRNTFETRFAAASGQLGRLGDIGIAIDRNGRYTVDADKLNAALASDLDGVTRLFSEFGSVDAGALTYIAATDATAAGTYAVDITQAAAAAAVTGTGFSGTYVDDATADTITVRDVAANRSYSVQLANGMSLAEIVDALNAEFDTAKQHTIEATNALAVDALGTPADDTTALAALFDTGGVNAGVQAGDAITIAGTKTDGTSFVTSFDITDPATQTLGDLRGAVAAAIGGDVGVSFANGKLTLTALASGPTSFTLSLTPDNAGGGTLSFGAFNVVTEGRGTTAVVASDVGGQLHLEHGDYGAAQGFELSFAAGGTGGYTALGLTAGTFVGQDVAGTIGGYAATGTGRTLLGDAGSPVEGLTISYGGATTGAAGNVTYNLGVAGLLQRITDGLLGSAGGSIDAVTGRLDLNNTRLNTRIDAIQARLDRRRDMLVKRFSALEVAMSQAQTQSAWLTSMINQLNAATNSFSGNSSSKS